MEHEVRFHENVHMPEEDFPVWAFYYDRDENSSEILFNLHWHEHMEIIHVVSGRMFLECDGRHFTAEPGDCVIMNSNELHSCPKTEGSLKLYCVIFDMSLLNGRYFDKTEIQYIRPILKNRISFHNLIQAETELSSKIIDICREMEDKKLGYELAAKSDMLWILVLLLRGHIFKILSSMEKSAMEKNNVRIDEVMRYIRDNYREEISIDTLSSSIFVSKYYLCKLFKKRLGRTITEYVNQVRIEAAEQLLQDGSLSVSEVAMETGFSDINYFSRIFKKNTGLSPSEYRKNSNQKQ